MDVMGFITGIWGKVIGAALAVLILVLGSMYIHHVIYKSGYDAAVADQAKRVDAQKAADQKHKDVAAAKVVPIQQQAQTKIDNSNKTLPATIKYVKVIVHDNPTFAACTRPAPLDQLRQTELEALRAAAAAGPFPASSSTAQLPGTTH
jgi:FtsZ-interacting cell division protein ZipA